MSSKRSPNILILVLFVLPIVSAQPARLPPIFAHSTESVIDAVPPVESKSLISSQTREKLTQLALGKTTVVSDPKVSLLKVDSQGEKDASPTSVVVMAPVVVQEDRPPELFIRRENDVEKFFRTGTFYQSVGKKVTTKVWAKGDRGIMLSFSW